MRTAIMAAAAALLAGTVSASAADLPARTFTKAPIAAPVYNWTGLYIGANAGIGGDKVDYPFAVGPIGGNLGLTSFGGFGGGQIGYNWQFGGNWLVGVEADIQGGSIKSELTAAAGPLALSAGSDVKYFGTVRGRVGYTFDRLLVYGTGGYAYGSEDTTLVVNPAIVNFKKSNDLSGWTAGGGVEYALANNFSLKTEYLYFDFDRNNVFSAAPFFNIDNKIHIHTIKLGLNYAIWK